MMKFRIQMCSTKRVVKRRKVWAGRMEADCPGVLTPYDLRPEVNWRVTVSWSQADPDLPVPWSWGPGAAGLTHLPAVHAEPAPLTWSDHVSNPCT